MKNSIDNYNNSDKKAIFFKLNKNIIAIIIITLVTSLYYSRWFNIKNISVYDEYESLLVAARLCGYKWAYATTYHGFGHTIIMVPFIKLLGTPNHVYWIFQLESLIFRIVSSVIAYFICQKCFFLSKSNALIIALSVQIGTLSATDNEMLGAMTEIPICLLALITAVLLAIYFKKGGNTPLGILGLELVFGFGLLIHSRMIILILVSFIYIFLFNILQKGIHKSNVLWVFFLLIYFGVNTINKYVVSNYYPSYYDSINLPSNVTNNIGGSIKYLLDIPHFNAAFTCFCSLLSNYVLYSFGIILIMFIACIEYVIKKINNKTFEKDILWHLTIWSWFVFLGMILAYSVFSQGSVLDNNSQVLTYIRYSIPYSCFPTICGLSIIIKEGINKRIAVLSTMGGLFFSKYVIALYFEKNDYITKSPLWNRISILNTPADSWYVMFASAIFMAIILFCLIIKKNSLLGIGIYCILSIVLTYSEYDYYLARSIDHDNPEISELVRKIEPYDNKVYLSPDYMYFFETSYFMHDFYEYIDGMELQDGYLITQDENINSNTNYYIDSILSTHYICTSSQEKHEIIHQVIEDMNLE